MRKFHNILLKIASKNPLARKELIKMASDIDPNLLKWFVARTKKAKGIVQMSMVEQAFALMPGWSITNTMGYHLFDDYFDQDIFSNMYSDWVSKWNPRIVSTEPKGGLNFIISGNVWEAQHELERQVQKVSGKEPSGPSQVGMIYATSPEELKEDWLKGKTGFRISKIWLGVPAWIITAPNGVTKTLASPINSKGKPLDPNRLDKFASFWTFLYKNGIDVSAKELLEKQDQQKIEDLALPAAQRRKVEQSRTLHPEVQELLRKIVDKKFQEVWDNKTDMHINALSRYLKEQDKSWEEQKAKGIERPSFSDYKLFKEIKYLGYFSSFFKEATEDDEERVLNKYVGYSGWKKRKSNYLDVARAAGKRLAEQMREEFVYKNGYKLSTIIRTKGNLQDSKLLKVNPGSDFGGEIKFLFKDGSSFIVRNKMIFKVSNLGKPFNQFPTTFHDVILPDGSNMSNPSEDRMVTVFAVNG